MRRGEWWEGGRKEGRSGPRLAGMGKWEKYYVAFWVTVATEMAVPAARAVVVKNVRERARARRVVRFVRSRDRAIVGFDGELVRKWKMRGPLNRDVQCSLIVGKFLNRVQIKTRK
jgi:hypothetical protein